LSSSPSSVTVTVVTHSSRYTAIALITMNEIAGSMYSKSSKITTGPVPV